MAITDICILVGIALFAVLGFRDGFFRKLFGILGLILGLIVATKFMSSLGDLFIKWTDFSNDVSNVLAFSFLFMGAMVTVNILFRWFGRSSKETLTFRSRLVGGVLGLAQGIVVVSLLTLMFSIFDIPSKEDREEAVLYEPITAVAPAVFDYTTSWMPASKDFFHQIKSQFEGKF